MGKPTITEEPATGEDRTHEHCNGADIALKESNGLLNGHAAKANGWTHMHNGAKEGDSSEEQANGMPSGRRKMRSSGSCPQLQDFADKGLEHMNGHVAYSDQSDSGLPHSRESLQRSSISTQESDEERREKGKGKKGSWWRRRGKSKQKTEEAVPSTKLEKDITDRPISHSRFRWSRGNKSTEPSSLSPPSSSAASKASEQSDMAHPEAGAPSWSTLQEGVNGIGLGLSADQHGLKSVAEHALPVHAAVAGCLASVFSRGSQASLADATEKAYRRKSWDASRAGHVRRSSDGSSYPLHDLRCSSSEVSRASSFEESFMHSSDAAPERSQSGSVLSRLASPFASWSHRNSKDHAADSVPALDAQKGDTDDSAGTTVTGELNGKTEKKGHRRHNSLTSFLPSLPALLAKRAASATLGEANRDKSPQRSNGLGGEGDSPLQTPAAPKTPELSRNVSALSCFGLGVKVTADDDGEQVEGSKSSNGDSKALPPGTVGLQNLGNTCFMNAAFQVLCHAPPLAAALVPELDDIARAAVQKLSEGPAGCASAAPASKPTEEAPATDKDASSISAPSEEGTPKAEDGASGTDPAGDAQSGAESNVDAAVGQLSPPQEASPVPQLPTITENTPVVPDEGVPSLIDPLIPAASEGDGDKTATEAAIEKRVEEAASEKPVEAIALEGPTEDDFTTCDRPATTAAPAAEAEAQTAVQPETPMVAERPIKTPSVSDDGAVPGIWDHGFQPAPDPSGQVEATGNQSEKPDAVRPEDSSIAAAETGDAADGSSGNATASQDLANIAASCTCQEFHAALAASAEAGKIAQAKPETEGESKAETSEDDVAQDSKSETPQPAAPKYPPLKRGDMVEAVRRLIREVYGGEPGSAFGPDYLIKKLYALPHGADFQDGGQHDCQEALRGLLQALHDDLKPAEQSSAEEEIAGSSANDEPEVWEEEHLVDETESAKADREWAGYLASEDSPITRLLAGQLQSSVTCHKCSSRFTMYEPFVDLSLPLIKEGKGGKGLSWFKSDKISILDCLHAFTAEELMQGDEAFQCEVCGERTSATKRLRLYRLPKILLLHIKRFKYSSNAREKISTNVTFPLKDLQLHQFVSEDSGLDEASAGKYNLTAVSNHFGNMVGGHYTAFCKAPVGYGKDERWFDYNDHQVNKMSTNSVATCAAYILCYCRKD